MAIKYQPSPLPAPQRLNFAVDKFYGVNRRGTVADGEFADCKNMSGDKFPYASPCMAKETVHTGISNPQKLLFCGDSLSYIDGGNLYVQGAGSFESKGAVGEVSSFIDFNNQKMLFFPSNRVYSYDTDTLEDIGDGLLVKASGSYTDAGVRSASADNVTLLYDSGYQTYADVFTLKATAETDYISASTAKDENGNDVTDENGHTVYSPITVNVSGNSADFLTSGTTRPIYRQCYMGLFVIAYDGDGNRISINPGYSAPYCYIREYEFGKPINVPGGLAARLYIMVGYYWAYDNMHARCEDISSCTEQRNADLADSDLKIWITKTDYPATNSIPHIDYACVDNNRVMGVSKNSFYASALGQCSDWTDFTDAEGNPKATGSYAEELNTYGDFSGIVKYGSSVILLKRDMLYSCYGGKPPYRINELCRIGCIDGMTVAEADGALYWLGRDGIYRFGGGLPTLVSDKLGETFTGGVACACGHKYYCCLYNDSGSRLFVYNTLYGFWHIEDSVKYVSLAERSGEVYGLTDGGDIVKFCSVGRTEWEFTTRDYDFDTERTKNLAKIYVRLRLYGQAWIDIYVRSDKQDWFKFANFKADGIKVLQAKAKLKKCDYFTLKFVGCGAAEIMDIYADATLGSQKHRSGNALTVFRKGQ